MIRKILGNNKGATAIEYGLIAALIAIAAIGAMGTLSTGLKDTFEKAGTELTAASGGGEGQGEGEGE